MKKIKILLLLLLPFLLHAQDYNISLIPDSLKENANAVKRFEELHIIIKGIDKAVIKHKYAITIMNEAGSRYAYYSNYYDNFHSLSDIDGTLYDAGGKELKNVKKKDIKDRAYEDGFSLMRDGRFKAHNFYYADYPYTVQYEDEMEYDGILGLPTWMPVEGFKYAVQNSKFIIETSPDYKLRYKQINYPNQPAVSKTQNTVYSWDLKNYKALKSEIFSPDFDELIPSVYSAPTEFIYGGYKGDMSTWLTYGKYQVDLNKGRDILPDNIKADVHRLTDNLNNPKEKTEALYKYLQANTRYISVQLGIGGLQPFEAKYVAANKYGDCKALSNYMVALLKEAGITGYYSIIHAGEGKKFYMPDFPSDQTNHIIVCVPAGKDTTWLECTSQTLAPGYLSSFTDDRYALVIKNDGGYLLKTPTYKTNDNLQIRHINSKIDETGKLIADVETIYTGLQQDDIQSDINTKSKKDLLDDMKKSLDIPSYDITALDYKEHKNFIPDIAETIKLTADNYATVSGKRIFITPNILSRYVRKIDTSEKRKFDIVYDHAFRDIDTVSIQLPANYVPEALPKNAELSNKFGKYKCEYKVSEDKVTYTRLLERSAGRFSPAEFIEFAQFVNAVNKADRSRIVFVKKE